MPRIRIAISLLSAAVIAYQLALIQILSIAHWHHFAYMVLSVAMLGFGASGTVLALFRSFFLRNSGRLIPVLSIITALSMASAVYLVEQGVGGFDTYLLFIDNSEIVKLLLAYLLYTMPFFFGALAIGLILTRHARDIGRIYFFNMAGSGAGGIIGISAMWLFYPEQLVSLIAILPLTAALISSASRLRKRKWFTLSAALTFIILFAGFYFPAQISISQYKSLSGTMNLPGAKIVERSSSPHGVTEAVQTDASRYAPGISLNYTGEVPVEPMIFVNGNWAGPVKNPDGATRDLFNQTTKQLAYIVREPERVLVTSAGTGRHVLHAVVNDAAAITAIESNAVLTRITDKISLDRYPGSILQHESVELLHQGNRAWLSRSQGGYSHIILPTLDAFGGTSGLYALQEQYDLTLDAFQHMWGLLLPDGVIAITSWNDQPPRNTLRILATLAGTASANGIDDPSGHIAAVRSWSTITYVLSRSPLSAEVLRRVREFSSELQFDPALLPDINESERQEYSHTDPAFFEHMDMILTGDREAFYDEYLFNIRPVTDNRPFFSQFLKTGSFAELDALYGRQSVPFIELGYLVLLLTGVQILVAGILFIILPLFRLGWRGNRKSWTLFYFGGIGTGFMLVEVNLIQQFIHFFGQPVYATAVVLSVLLISSGTGSYFSHKLIAFRRGIETLLLSLVVLILILQAILPAIIDVSVAASMPVRLIIAVMAIAPAGFLMGMPFPGGIRRLSMGDSTQIPWAWGINGCFSVFSTVVAVWLALESGYSTVLITGAGAYLIAAVATWFISSAR